MKTKLLKCCICKKDIKPKGTWTQGNNAMPIKKGRCCDECNDTVVLKERLSRAFNKEVSQ